MHKAKKWFTSDLHLGDYRVIPNTTDNFRKRPFNSLSDHNRIILENTNNCGIQKVDELYIVGDVCFNEQAIDLLSFLPNCRKILVIGNHDVDKIDLIKPYFDEVHYQLEIELKDGTQCFLTHYPTDCHKYIHQHPHLWGLCGHVHEVWKKTPISINVGVDVWGYTPISEDKIIAEIQGTKQYCLSDRNCFPYEIISYK